MSVVAIIGAVVTLLIEVFKLINDIRADKKEEQIELKKQKTQALQSALRGIIDGDESRYINQLELLRRLRQK